MGLRSREHWAALYALKSTAVTLSVSFTVPQAVFLEEEAWGREGRCGSSLDGHCILLGSTHYVWYRHDSTGVDPGDRDTESELAGRTGIEVTLGAGTLTSTQVATATASAIDGTAGFSATSTDDQVDVTGASSAAAGATTHADKGAYGILGMRDISIGGGAAVDTERAMQIDPADLPGSGLITIKGFVAQVTAHSSGVDFQVGVHQGGSDGNPTGATLAGTLGATSGTATGRVFVAASTPIVLDVADGPIWLTWMGDGAGVSIAFVGSGTAAAISSNFRTASGIQIFSTGTSGSGSSFASTVPSGSTPVAFVAALALVYEAEPFQTDMLAKGRIGTRFAEDSPSTNFTEGTSGALLLVGNSFQAPFELEWDQFSVNYDTHSEGSDYRYAVAVGGTADDDYSGAVWQDLGQTSGTATGWVDVDVPLSTVVTVPANTRFFQTIKFDGSGSVLSFDQTTPGEYSPEEEPAAFYLGNTTESECDDGTFLGSGATTNVDFDPAVATPVGAFTPNGTVFQNNNSPGVRGRYRIRGTGGGGGFAIV